MLGGLDCHGRCCSSLNLTSSWCPLTAVKPAAAPMVAEVGCLKWVESLDFTSAELSPGLSLCFWLVWTSVPTDLLKKRESETVPLPSLPLPELEVSGVRLSSIDSGSRPRSWIERLTISIETKHID